MKNYYKILEVSENASQEVIEKAYRVLAKKYHPDIQPADKIFWAENNFKQITEAYEVLSDVEKRKKYNKDLGLGTNGIDYYTKYNNLYAEKEELKQELHREKFKNSSQEYINKNKKQNEKISYTKSIFQTLGNMIYSETKKSKSERQKDLKALLLTIIIISILLFIAFKIPAIKNYLFPF